MRTLAIALALAGMVATPVLAQQSTAPGQRMHQSDSVKGTTGASGYAPGHLMRKHKHHASLKATHGAKAFAPGRQAKSTVGLSTRSKTKVGMSSKIKSKSTVGLSTSRSKSTVGMSKGDRDTSAKTQSTPGSTD